MRNPDRTYTTLLDRAEYALKDQIRIMNYNYYHMETTTEPTIKKRYEKELIYYKKQMEGMLEMFDSVFRDFTVNYWIDLDNVTHYYNIAIEAR